MTRSNVLENARHKLLLATLAMIGAVAACGPVVAANSNAATFGKGLPRVADELPPGLLRSSLDRLPSAARSRALRWLQSFEFPAADVTQLRVDPRGGVFYEDPAVDDAVEDMGSNQVPLIGEIDATSVFTLHSKPGASRTVYLDMDGHVVTGTVWNNGTGVDQLFMQPYDTDGNTTNLSQDEINAIAEVWKRIAEDYAPFDIDVTTEAPAVFGPNVGHILVTRKADENGNEIYSCSCGGVAYVGVWGQSNFPNYQPALVFQDGVNSVHSISEAASHELGHNLGLSHDGTSTSGYYLGHGDGNTSWAPIMGAGYYANVSQWSKGEYADATNTQDDLEIIRGRLTYRPDDHEDLDFAYATALMRSDDTTIASTTLVSDPDNLNSHNKGVIEDRADVDLFYFDVGGGTVDLSVIPAWRDAYKGHSLRGTNLDIQATLYDVSGIQIAQSNPLGETDARIVTNVAAGRYLLAVNGVGEGDSSNGYSDYGSLGHYYVSGSIPSDVSVTEPPTAPNDLTATLFGENNIELTWTDPVSTVTSNESGYRVLRQQDGGTFVEIANLVADSSSFNDNNLANHSYVYQLEVFNSAGSTWTSTTDPLTVTAPSFAYATGENTQAGSILSGSFVDTNVPGGAEQLVERHQGGKPRARVSRLDHRWTVSNVAPGANMTLAVVAEAPANNEDDDFRFSWSSDGNSYQEFATLENGTGSQTLSTSLPATAAGTVWVRVEDSDRSTGNSETDTVIVSLIEAESTGEPGEQAPLVTISEPVDGVRVEQGYPLVLGASADDYEDGDISAGISWYSNINGALANGPRAEVTMLTIGTHVISARVTDSAGNNAEDNVTVTVADPNAPSTVRVANLQGTAQTAKRNRWLAEVVISMVDTMGTPVANATVSGNWSGGANGGATCTSNGNGQCVVSKGGLKSSVSSVTFSITGIVHSNLDYDASGVSSVTITSPN